MPRRCRLLRISGFDRGERAERRDQGNGGKQTAALNQRVTLSIRRESVFRMLRSTVHDEAGPAVATAHAT